MRVRLRLFPDRVEALLIDQGAPFNLTLLPSISDNPADIMDVPEGGYGLLIARAALDSLRYRRTRSGFNCWKLVKKVEG